jgi:hypothetical protein
MQLTDHLTETQLNEYLDNESTESAQIESHLLVCSECATRLSEMQLLFDELESLPELELSRDLSTRFVTSGGLIPQLPRWLTLTVTLQAVFALIALIVAIPFIAAFIPQIDVTSLTTPLFEIQFVWNTWLDSLSTFQLPTIPELPIIEVSSLLIAVAGIFVLWVFGNGLLLRNQNR